MSKKLLNEAAVRRFMGLAGMQANVVSNMVSEMNIAEEEVEESTSRLAQEDLMEEEEVEELPVEDEMDLAPVEDELPPEMEMEAPEMEITSEEADVLVGILEKLLAARPADEPEMDMEPEAEEEMGDDIEVEEEEELEDMMENESVDAEEEISEDKIVQEVARRVTARILKAKAARKEMNKALGK